MDNYERESKIIIKGYREREREQNKHERGSKTGMLYFFTTRMELTTMREREREQISMKEKTK